MQLNKNCLRVYGSQSMAMAYLINIKYVMYIKYAKVWHTTRWLLW